MTESLTAIRSWLYVPAHRPELLAKAMAGPADAVVYDLEDAVPPLAKKQARENAVAAAGAGQPKPLWVRINDPSGPAGEADVAALAGSAVSGVRVPKCTDPDLVAGIAERLGAPLHLLVESAVGVENAFALVRSHRHVAIVSLGETDLLADLRADDPTALEWARQRIVIANRAAGLPNPPQSVWIALDDMPGLIADSERARDRGFFGRSAVHPKQVEPINSVFTPSAEQVARARRLLDSLREYGEHGSAAWVDERGGFVDPAVVAGARWVLERNSILSGGGA